MPANLENSAVATGLDPGVLHLPPNFLSVSLLLPTNDLDPALELGPRNVLLFLQDKVRLPQPSLPSSFRRQPPLPQDTEAHSPREAAVTLSILPLFPQRAGHQRRNPSNLLPPPSPPLSLLSSCYSRGAALSPSKARTSCPRPFPTSGSTSRTDLSHLPLQLLR